MSKVIEQLAVALSGLLEQVETFTSTNGEADFETAQALAAVEAYVQHEALAQQGQAKTSTEFEDQAIDAEIDAMLASNEASDSIGRERETRKQLAAALRKIRRLERAQQGQGEAFGLQTAVRQLLSDMNAIAAKTTPIGISLSEFAMHAISDFSARCPSLTAPQPLPDREPTDREADPFTQIIQHLNSSPYSLTKEECIDVVRKLRAAHGIKKGGA